MDESLLRTRLKKEWKPCHFTNIEGVSSFGMPDCHVTVEASRAWIELKVNYNGHLLFQPNQLAWMEREYKLGADTWIVWFDSRLRCCTYTYLRDWPKVVAGKKVKVTMNISETFSGTFQEVKDVIFGVYIQE